MEYLVERAAVDPDTRWRRTFQLGSKAELLVVIKQPEGLEGPAFVNLVTDTASDVVLHWGYCMPGEVGGGWGKVGACVAEITFCATWSTCWQHCMVEDKVDHVLCFCRA
jgi:hypothetical protein